MRPTGSYCTRDVMDHGQLSMRDGVPGFQSIRELNHWAICAVLYIKSVTAMFVTI